MRIESGLIIGTAVLALALGACQPAAPPAAADATAAQTATDPHAADGSHDAHGQDMALLPAPETPWASDAPLRQGMEGIAAAVKDADSALAAGSFDDARAATLAAAVDEQVQYMFGHCELPPDADAALHVLLTQLLGAANGIAPDNAQAGLAKMRELLSHYPHYFEHAGWAEAAPKP